ncbi:hypothetical protein HNR24_000007 [Nesterenkonia jeotgali]|uniref:Uncharacterized protein n=1 Tax=Nesterenkonia jeotgali TaxID=317018 RepID=A0A839FSJ0_9MICC|nr:hypothetical protein [Nesterenkonia jeotgali]
MIEERLIDQIATKPLKALVVFTEIVTAAGTPRYRRRVHLSLVAAQNAVTRAQQRGLEARMILCRLEPVGDEGGSDVLDKAG